MAFFGGNRGGARGGGRGGGRGAGRGNQQLRWNKFETNVGTKRVKKNLQVKELVVSRVGKPEGKQGSRYQPCEDRQYVPFEEYDGVTIKNVSAACENYWGTPPGSCCILASNTGPVCFQDDQIQGKKLFLVTFQNCDLGVASTSTVDQGQGNEEEHPPPKLPRVLPEKKKKNTPPPSVSLSQILRAGSLKKARKYEEVRLEEYDVTSSEFNDVACIHLFVEDTHFASGAHRHAFKGYEKENNDPKWVVKRYREDSPHVLESMELIETNKVDHTYKQVAMHMASKGITEKFSKNAPEEFGEMFQMTTAYIGHLKDEVVAVEEYVPGEYQKYVNNTGNVIEGMDQTLKEKAECLVHYSYEFSGGQLMLVDIQGSGYSLYDPEIATSIEASESEEGAARFCIGNLRKEVLDNFKQDHNCNDYCALMKLSPLTREEGE